MEAFFYFWVYAVKIDVGLRKRIYWSCEI